MKKRIVAFLYALSGFMPVVSSCNDLPSATATDQAIYFEVNYVNHAWGEQYKGFLVGKDGKIGTYDNPSLASVPIDSESFTADKIDEKWSMSRISAAVPDLGSFSSNVSKIPQLKETTLTKPVQRGADMGATSYYAYRFDRETSTYRRILLKQTGDFEIGNTDPEAVAVADWLAQVSKEIYK
jgi:hypothetical protein